ncbi:hypothetical protein [Pontiella sulfatireligans]|uniref:Auto-transporter adhesin head GIN domain-containing protein n=1 Tax=Pontiella sulfatireligans TaxID=2750658 RepID=A0A6C2ULT9_9BACT|nr:hypothetical protein [Pontiella sulfatireligans]VGO20929.1 hypothetical protein SCARR_02996 [Pontiella sulfatireligans]
MELKGKIIAGLMALSVATLSVSAQNINVWRGDETGADWNDKFKWKLKHTPEGDESVHFREENSLVAINRTIQLNNGIQLYGRELTLGGNGNINLLNPVPHQQTVNIPAAAAGLANMTLNDNLSLNGRIALSAKAFGTSQSKGSITLRNRSNVSGALSVGNAGSGTGQVYVRDQATYRITELELNTKASDGGAAEIHILGGTVRLETAEDPFSMFLEDSSRKVVIGDMGTLRVESKIEAETKKKLIINMIRKKRLVAALGCRLKSPVINNKMLIIQAEDQRNESKTQTVEQLIAAIQKMPVQAAPAYLDDAPRAASALVAATDDGQSSSAEDSAPGMHLSGYIVFCGTCLLALRRASKEENG